MAMGVSLFYMGEFHQARIHLEQVIAFYDPEQHRSLVFLYGLDLGVIATFLPGLGSMDPGLSGSGPQAGSRRWWRWLESWIIPFPWPLPCAYSCHLSLAPP